MSKVIKVEEAVYTQLDTLRVGRQTFSDVIDDLLTGRLKILEAIQMLEGILKYREWQREQLNQIQTGLRR